MGLKIIHNKAPHTHENVQFRRISIGLKELFKKQNWDGLLIGNPENENFSRFRADAILLYNYGLIVIDLKEYSGDVELPTEDLEFDRSKWYNYTANNERIVIKGGSRFINPFKQLQAYRGVMYDIINSDVILRTTIKANRVCALNIFSGPINLQGKIPGRLPYYKLCEESNLGTFLYDFTSDNNYDEESANVLQTIFPGDDFVDKIDFDSSIKQEEGSNIKIQLDLDKSLTEFVVGEDSGIYVVQSMDQEKRDGLVDWISHKALDCNIPQTEVWTHSSRVRRRIFKRSGVQCDSLYNSIYGGVGKNRSSENDEGEESVEENLLEVISLKNDDWLDDKALIIVLESHLISRSLHRSELLQFGSGRLLEDLLEFSDLENSKRKIVFIGDPYSLSYGKIEESALWVDNLKEISNVEIKVFKDDLIYESNAISKLRRSLAASMDNGFFNELNFLCDGKFLIDVSKEKALDILNSWFNKPLNNEPSRVFLGATNNQVDLVNKHIKKRFLQNGEEINTGDLILVNNNVNVADSTGLEQPRKLVNGMYLTITEVMGTLTELVHIKQSDKPIELKYVQVQAKTLSLVNNVQIEVLLSLNYLFSKSKLSREEQIAFSVYAKQKEKLLQKESPFEDSFEYKKFVTSSDKIDVDNKIVHLKEQLKNGDRVKVKLESFEKEERKLRRTAQRKYRSKIKIELRSMDPFINAVNGSYGWAITVDKAVGASYSEICINSFKGENVGVKNRNYFNWLYSGITTGEKVYVLNKQEFSPLSGCDFSETVTENRNGIKKSTFSLVPLDEHCEPYLDFFPEKILDTPKAIIVLIATELKKIDFNLTGVSVPSEYLTKMIVKSLEGNEISINIDNNKSGEVSNVRIDKCPDQYKLLLDEVLELMLNQTEKLPADWRGEIYTNWKVRANVKGFVLRNYKSEEWNDWILLSNSEVKISFHVGYDKSGFITRINEVTVIKGLENFEIEDLKQIIFASE